MALNIQRALEGREPAPFPADELYQRHVDSSHVLLLDAARWCVVTRHMYGPLVPFC